MAIRGYNAYQSGGQSNLLKVVCQDGISYYIYALALAFTDIILALELPVRNLIIFLIIYFEAYTDPA
ncbi:hypothetical protein BDQ12DRAFT_730092 [Crucibulum laeve]|uniref:Uncharacterized protein n=1 Tax=Crucibulum laeve TaxID=68775 RepID=A0A5C3LD18_9AGAR|nr:hypothetical protein BDQ12DRAFT_730092 [Crucibulum laeve]